jgi:hypothetical protein
MKKYIEQLKTIEAIQWDGTKEEAIKILAIENVYGKVIIRDKVFKGFFIELFNKEVKVEPGDYIVKDWHGDVDLMSKKIFEKLYKLSKN